jgi:hypothetical protein
VFVTTALLVSLAAPVPKEKPSDLYFPTVEGTKRVMQQKEGNETVEITETVTKVVEKDGTYTVTVDLEIGGGVLDLEYEVSAKGVFSAPNPKLKLAGWPLLQLPAKKGDTWATERKSPGDTTTKLTYTVGKEEEVTVPAGKYKAIAVTCETMVNRQAESRITSWYAAGVGVVKTVFEIHGKEWVHELKEFTPGKAK